MDKQRATFNLSKKDIEKILEQCLKPEEISGEAVIQLARIKELVHWFRRFIDGNANPKWFRPHVFELVYYIATSAGNRFIDLEAVRQKAYIEGINITPAERALMEKMNLISVAAAPQAHGPFWVTVSDSIPEWSNKIILRFIDSKDPFHWQDVQRYDEAGRQLEIRGFGWVPFSNVEWLDERPRPRHITADYLETKIP